MAAGANATVSDETVKVYMEELRGYSQAVLDAAVDRVVREWREASKMPVIPFVLERCMDLNLHKSATAIMGRESKPPGWEPLTDELKAEFAEALQAAKAKHPATTR